MLKLLATREEIGSLFETLSKDRMQILCNDKFQVKKQKRKYYFVLQIIKFQKASLLCKLGQSIEG